MERPLLRVGLVGAGRIAEFVHLPSLALLPDQARVTAVAARDPARTRALAARWGISRVLPDWKALVEDPEVDAIVVCTPSDLNAQVAAAAVAAGKHVLAEKPLALGFPEADRLRAAAERARIVHMVAFTFRFPAALRYLRRLVEEGHFGQIRHWRAAFLSDGMLDPTVPLAWRNQRRHAGAGILADMGSHLVDLARHLVGDLGAVSGAVRTYVGERPLPGGGLGPVDAPDACAWIGEFEGGAIGTFDLSRAVAGRGGTGRGSHMRLEVMGTGGSAVYELGDPFHLWISLGPALTRPGHLVRVEVPVDLLRYPGSPRGVRADDPLVGYKWDQGVAFVKAVRGETRDYPTFVDGAEAQRVVDAVETSAREGRRVPVR